MNLGVAHLGIATVRQAQKWRWHRLSRSFVSAANARRCGLHSSRPASRSYSEVADHAPTQFNDGAEDAVPRLENELAATGTSPAAQIEPAVEHTSDENIDHSTADAAEDAKLEIYNFAASQGFMAQYEVCDFTKTPPRGFRARRAARSGAVVRVTIRIPELQINTSGAGKDLPTAELSAALSFKREAERRHATAQEPAKLFHLLNDATAGDFIDHYSRVRPEASLEKERARTTIANVECHSVTIKLDGEPIGNTGIMKSDTAAEAVASVTAALQLARAEPELLDDFARAMRTLKGRSMTKTGPIPFEIDTAGLVTMREGLVQARQAGLPDVKNSMDAEANPPAHRSREPNLISLRSRQRLSEQLLAEKIKADSEGATIESCQARLGLPVFQHRTEVLDMVKDNRCSIIVGTTGSGKTTQVPQILLDDAISRGRGGHCGIICTQPRRIAASSVARRVATERNEPLQQSTGYRVRLDSRPPRQGGSITYCTTGFLLEQLKHDSDRVLDGTSHLIVDEVHERERDVDFLLILIKKALQTRTLAGKSVPKIILMSATMNTELFTTYFEQGFANVKVSCATLTVPGRQFPVHETYLEELLEQMSAQHAVEVKRLVNSEADCKDFVEIEKELILAEAKRLSIKQPVIDWKHRSDPASKDEELKLVREERQSALVPVPLLAAVIAYICSTQSSGAIIAFLPGIGEITDAATLLRQRPIFGVDFDNTDKFRILCLHSSVPADEQKLIFEDAPPGCRKIILSTNIAETSITVPDVRFVVDAGKVRENRYDSISRVDKLQCVWESDTNARQRAGRAGRLQAGFYYALYSRERRALLQRSGIPDLLRTDLSETVLSIKARQFPGPVSAFLREAIEPPPQAAISAAVDKLEAIEALTSDEQLTPLGRFLAKLPLRPELGRMLMLGILFKCLDSMIIIGAMSNERSLFTVPMSTRQAAIDAHKGYGVQQSDQLAQLEAFKELRTIRIQSGMDAVRRCAREKYLHVGAFLTIESTARQIESILSDEGLIPTNCAAVHSPNRAQYGDASLNEHSEVSELIKGLILAGTHPNLAVRKPRRLKVHRTKMHNIVLQESTSQNSLKVKEAVAGQMYAYSRLSQTVSGSDVYFMRESTLVTPLMVALFGGTLSTRAWKTLDVDEWLPFELQRVDGGYVIRLVLEFRKALDRVLGNAIQSLLNVEGLTVHHDDAVTQQFLARVLQLLQQESVAGPTTQEEPELMFAAKPEARLEERSEEE